MMNAVLSTLVGIVAAAGTMSYPAVFDPSWTEEPWFKQCLGAETAAPPPRDLPQATHADCDAMTLYYDKRSQASTTPAEWRKVRHCAFSSGNDAVLMMLYANGFGVARDPRLATKYACSLDGASKSEMEARATYLSQGAQGRKVFDLCDDITSGRMGAVCTIREDQAGKVRSRRLASFAARLTAPEKAAFQALQATVADFAERRAFESDMHGTAAADFAMQLVAHEREQFLQDVLSLQRAELFPASEADFEDLDRQLNASYDTLMKANSVQQDWPGRLGESTIEKEDVRKTERAWLAYRDAWVSFGALVAPSVDASAWKGVLTKRRLGQLMHIAQY